MWVVEASTNSAAVHEIAANMREWDRREIFATRFDEEPHALAAEALRTGPMAWVSGMEDPIAAFGCQPLWPGVFMMWLFATDDFRQIRFSMTKLVRRYIVPMLFDAGAHRLQAYSMEGHDEAHGWLELIGARREATMIGFGRDGQNFHIYVWDRR